jgi:hypothetical protein
LRDGIINDRVIMLNDVDLSQADDEGVVNAFRPADYLPDDVTINRLEDYGGGPLYEVKTSDDQLVGYLNATPSGTGPSVIIYGSLIPILPQRRMRQQNRHRLEMLLQPLPATHLLNAAIQDSDPSHSALPPSKSS